jgi:hypothetical protein
MDDRMFHRKLIHFSADRRRVSVAAFYELRNELEVVCALAPLS